MRVSLLALAKSIYLLHFALNCIAKECRFLSRVEGKMSRVKGKLSRVEGRLSRVVFL